MADVIRKATNKFTKGLVMDFSPENTRNEVLTHALNATLLTFNGNELSLQNDMGNARVETAYLPEGYMPVGTCEYGGIIYIVSYNPLEDKSLIGCFPSPERNISNKELGISDAQISSTYFQEKQNGVLTGKIKNTTQYVLLKNDSLNPGDKFLICANKGIYKERLDNLLVQEDGVGDFNLKANPVIALNVVSIEDSGKIVYLNSDIRYYNVQNTYTDDNGTHTDTYRYHILGDMKKSGNTYSQESVDPDEYRNVLSSGYSVFKSKTSGKLAILAELITIDSYSVTHSLQPKEDSDGSFDIIIHTEVEPKITSENYNIVPKLQYYYLDKSLGYLQAVDDNMNSTVYTLFIENNGEITGEFNKIYDTISLSKIYEPTYNNAINLNQTLGQFGQFNFPKSNTYHGNMKEISNTNEADKNVNTTIYTKFQEGKYHRIHSSQVKEHLDSYYLSKLRAKFYEYLEDNEQYSEWTQGTYDNSYTYYIETTKEVYVDAARDVTHQSKELFELTTSLHPANDTAIKDKEVEKFQFVLVYKYREATQQDIDANKTLFTKNGNTYTQITGQPVQGMEYYVQEVEQALVSIGKDVTQETHPGEIYYYPTTKEYKPASKEAIDKYWDFETYPKENEAPYGCPVTLYYRETITDYRVATETEILHYLENNKTLLYKLDYRPLTKAEVENFSDTYQLFIVVTEDTFVSPTYFKYSETYNYILMGGTEIKPPIKDIYTLVEEYPKDDPITLYIVSDFIPTKDSDNSQNYQDLRLASIKIPETITSNGLDLPFKYDYAIVPCMQFGRLQHLAVSNTIDFSKLHAFKQSNFTTWKYRIDDNQLRLTFGAEIFDTYETDKVNGLVLEFYDTWGFVGSIEISDKKSYSGIFNKIIPLNTLNALSDKKIIANKVGNTVTYEYKSGYAHNVNIIDDPQKGLILNGKNVYFDQNQGWSDIKGTPIENNDCGTLYSNLVYGVKAYIRRNTANGVEYIKKKDLFLYTLPIYNDYYYTTDDFSGISNPELDLVLTYKLKDLGTKTILNCDGVDLGYTTGENGDKEKVAEYLSGTSSSGELNLVKYYKYFGNTLLLLEIGLKKDYESLNLSYDKDINKYFSCQLHLLNDEGTGSFKLNSTSDAVQDDSLILNYGDVPFEDNYLIFSGSDNTKDIKYPTKEGELGFELYNFLTSNPNTPLLLEYSFIVGYKASITDIRASLVPATTICALFHKNSNGELNYEDFGVYKQENSTTSSEPELLSDKMFYNGGTKDLEIFGICRQIKTSGINMLDECQSITSIESEAQEITTAGKLNSGEPLAQLSSQIGKLTFCQPHAHGMSEENGVNIHEGNTTEKHYGIPAENGGFRTKDGSTFSSGDWDSAYGTNPRTFLFHNPKYNLSLNTKNSLIYNSEFISTLDWNLLMGLQYGVDSSSRWVAASMREYTGFTGVQIEQFNRKMLKTMESVYAYNPDYDTLQVSIGNVSLQDYYPYFTSNILSKNANLTYPEKTEFPFNDFVYLGGIKFSEYLNGIQKYSGIDNEAILVTEEVLTEEGSPKEIRFKQELNFTPNLEYCGYGDNYYLISQLTYNTPVPPELETELEFNASGCVVVKHSDGSTNQISGTPNKKALYGYDKDTNKLVQLDVTNYVILDDGILKLLNTNNTKHTRDFNGVDMIKAFSEGYGFDIELPQTDGSVIKVPIKISFELLDAPESGIRGSLLPNSDGTKVYFEVQREYQKWTFSSNEGLRIRPKFTVNSTDLELLAKIENYTFLFDSLTFDIRARLLHRKWFRSDSGAGDRYSLQNLSISEYELLLGIDPNSKTTLINANNKTRNSTLKDWWEYDSVDEHQLWLSGQQSAQTTHTISPEQMNFMISYDLIKEFIDTDNAYKNDVEFYCIDFKSVAFIVLEKMEFKGDERQIIPVARTNRYSNIVNYRYQVLPYYNDAQLKGTSLTLNDLVYEPDPEGHRLFIRNNLCVYDLNYYRSKLYYRFLNGGDNAKHSSWNYQYKHYNALFLFTGPCFTESNL